MHCLKDAAGGELKMSALREEFSVGAREDFVARRIEAVCSGSEQDEFATEPRGQRQNDVLELAGISGDGQDDGHGFLGPGADLAGGGQSEVGGPDLEFEGFAEGAPEPGPIE